MDIVAVSVLTLVGFVFGGFTGAMIGNKAGRAANAEFVAWACDKTGAVTLDIKTDRYRVDCDKPKLMEIQPWE